MIIDWQIKGSNYRQQWRLYVLRKDPQTKVESWSVESEGNSNVDLLKLANSLKE
jgi:hypothetical protein